MVYQDELLVAVNKSSGIAVGGDRWDETKDRLDKLLTATFGRVYTTHRIDSGTSGIVVFARSREAHAALSRAFETRRVKKTYIAVIHGRVSWTETSCDFPLVPNGDKQHRTIIDKYRGKKSFTRFRLLHGAGNYSVVEAEPETGRTHQIRAHLAGMGCPVVCDPLYGKPGGGRAGGEGVFLSSFKRGWRGDPLDEKPLLNRLGLHAAALVLPDCRAGKAELVLNAPLSRDMAALIRQLEKRS